MSERKRGIRWHREEVCCDCGALETRRRHLARLIRDWPRRNEPLPNLDPMFAIFSERLLNELRPTAATRNFLRHR